MKGISAARGYRKMTEQTIGTSSAFSNNISDFFMLVSRKEKYFLTDIIIHVVVVNTIAKISIEVSYLII